MNTRPVGATPPAAFIAALIAVLSASLFAGCATPPPRAIARVAVKVLAINDFHGNLLPPLGGIRIKDPADPGKTVVVAAGGAQYLASAVAELRSKNRNHIFVAAGDLIGASPLLSALFRDEPTIQSLSLMGLEVSAVGNHEFDRGSAELLRMQHGGCHPVDGCKGPTPFTGARFKYLAASTVVEATGQTLFPAVHVKHFDGIPVAFIGLTLKDTPTIVVPSGVQGLRFRDEAQTVNELVPQLRSQGIEAIVVLIHEGGLPSGDYNECPGISGPIVDIVKQLDPAVDLDPSTLTFGATGDEESLAFCNTGGGDGDEADVNHDGQRDLLCHFYTQKADFCSDRYGCRARLRGETYDGVPIDGVDRIGDRRDRYRRDLRREQLSVQGQQLVPFGFAVATWCVVCRYCCHRPSERLQR